MSRSREAMNLGAELQAQKLKALLLGLTRNEPEDEITESLRIIARVGRENEQKQIAEGQDPKTV